MGERVYYKLKIKYKIGCSTLGPWKVGRRITDSEKVTRTPGEELRTFPTLAISQKENRGTNFKKSF